MTNPLVDSLRRIITLGMRQEDLYCTVCKTWQKSRNDPDGHDKAFACGIANATLKEYAKRVPTISNPKLVNSIAMRLSGLTVAEWEAWEAKPYQVRNFGSNSSPESFRNDAKDIINIIESFIL